MKKIYKIIPFILFLLLAGLKGYSQAEGQQTDTLRVQSKDNENAEKERVQARNGNRNGQTSENSGSNTAKQVRGSRPDMTRARGARPPSIVRPSGSGIPKGIGKPGGAGRKGGR